MGCDIHTVIEERVDGRWIGVCASDCVKGRPDYAERDYTFFSHIANVRGSGPNYAKGLPRDISELAWHLYSRHPTDHHHPSHMGLHEFCAAHNSVRPSASRTEYAVEDLTGIYSEEDEQFRVVFWFDN